MLQTGLSVCIYQVHPLWLGSRNEQYSLLAVMSELSNVQCDHVLSLWLQVHGRRVSTESCRGGAQAGRHLWHPLMDRGRKQRRMAGFLVCATKPSRRTAVEDAKSWRHGRRSRDWRRNGRRRHLEPRCGRGGDGRRAASRAVRRPRRERRPGHGMEAESSRAWSFGGFLKTGHLPGFRGPSKTADWIFVHTAASRRRLRLEERTSTVG